MKRARILCAVYEVDDLRYQFVQNEAWEDAVNKARADGEALRKAGNGKKRAT